MTRPATPRTVHLYHHTHWDREWWATRERFRFRLVHTIDAVLDALGADEKLSCFVLDGQTIVLKDYLHIRPERQAELGALIRAERLFVGPWHILPDEFLVSGEATIRNLWLGERTARALGVPLSRVGYLPDQFGHIAQMPQLLAGFGIDSAVVWRGFGGPPVGGNSGEAEVSRNCYLYPRARDERFPAEVQSEFWWEALNGSRVLGVFLPLEYYRSHFTLSGDPTSTDQTVGRARRASRYLASYAATDALLEPLGGDHLNVDPNLPTVLTSINEVLAQEGVHYQISSLDAFVRDVRRQQERVQVVWQGEGRAFGRKAHLLPGVLSARLYLKQRNVRAQSALERFAEPLQALHWLLGEAYEHQYLWNAWERLIENHPHDSICGCSIDQVHREMLTRFDEAQQMADLLSEDAHASITSRVDASFAPDGHVFTVFNPLNWARTDEVRLLMNVFLDIHPEGWELIDHEGQTLPFQVRTVRSSTEKAEAFSWLGVSGHGAHDEDQFCEVGFVARDVPGIGYRAYALRPRSSPARHDLAVPYQVLGNVALNKGDLAVSDLAVGPGVLENALLRVTVGTNGSLELLDKTTLLTYPNLNSFDDGGDNGDSYNYAWPLGDQVFSTECLEARHAWQEVGPARATLRVTWAWSLPEGLSDDRQSRSARHVPFTLHSDITLHAGVKRVDIRTHFDNPARDHRLRARFPLGAPITHSSAETQYGVVERPVRLPDDQRGSSEPAVHEHPQLHFVSVTDGARGLSVLNRGLPEFSAREDGSLCLTVLRAVGWLSRADFLTRVGGAGPTIATPEAQMLGPVEAEYSLVPHAGSWDQADVWRDAHDFNAPLHAATRTSQVVPLRNRHRTLSASLPPLGQLVRVTGRVLVTAIKRAEDHGRLIIRFVNQTPQPQDVSVRIARQVTLAERVNLREEHLSPLDVENDTASLRVQPWEIVTLAFRVTPADHQEGTT
ncbi:alpha-mannosidase [Deinococcus peraridilitoris]|uniref:Alpha-mannosidase n=1 Tax=Deinococcus peraridilitoris (strain DSM 19664 / LMG 22246 / CIP 109416 / KR-200) TaxID=937777 RepID=K9ZVM1_DEIPD|nr:glycoside hydrolase family 38 C-terminal domain-containing protein [Deinococcus peraridilitoris]AFZ65648.1 alpha-mannosidase [Deinococcus peraridilitoris DSM 19664]